MVWILRSEQFNFDITKQDEMEIRSRVEKKGSHKPITAALR
jgi:hypothetical protein